jgi:cell division protein FtsX
LEEAMSDTHLPDRRKHGYKELEEKLDAHIAAIEKKLDDHIKANADRLRRFFAKALAAFAVLGITSALGLLGFGVVLKNEGRTTDEIQQQRFQVVLDNCVSQNARHDRTIVRAKSLSGQQQRVIGLLVDELQPFVKDCEKQARDRVQGLG